MVILIFTIKLAVLPTGGITFNSFNGKIDCRVVIFLFPVFLAGMPCGDIFISCFLAALSSSRSVVVGPSVRPSVGELCAKVTYLPMQH